jgi:hypothetical protein
VSRKFLLVSIFAAALVFGICWPGIRTLIVWTWILKQQPGSIRADFPSGWKHIEQTTSVTAVNPCWTLFCSSPRSTFVLAVQEVPILRERSWSERAKKEFADGQFGSAVARTFPSGLGQVECLEARREPNLAEVRCYATSSGLTADFSGTVGDLQKFYHTVTSAAASSERGRPQRP